MKYTLKMAAALLVTTAPAMAGGIERGGQFLGPLFEPGNYAEFSFGYVDPEVTGKDIVGANTGNVADSYNQIGMAYKHQYTENWSAAVILDQPFGADVLYPESSPVLGGTAASVDGYQITGVGRYFMPENGFGVHAGVRVSTSDASVKLRGAAYGGINGYDLDLDNDTAYGWLAGVSWEKPEIAARVSLTYSSEIEHEYDTNETLPALTAAALGLPTNKFYGGKTTVNSPKSVNLEFQTGLNEKTLAFGSVRWVDWSSFKVAPPVYGAIPDPCQATGQCPLGSTLGSLTDLEDTTTVTLGVGRKFTDAWSGAASFTYEKSGDDLVSPLAPTNGKKGISLAAIYTRDKMKITTGISYVKVGDAMPETGTPDEARATMKDNDVWGVGVKVGYSF